jgi:Domain of unknown function (DUF4476)
MKNPRLVVAAFALLCVIQSIASARPYYPVRTLLSQSELQQLAADMRAASLSEDRLTVFRRAMYVHAILCDQLLLLLPLFQWRRDQLLAVQASAYWLADQENRLRIVDFFSGVDDRAEAARLLGLAP